MKMKTQSVFYNAFFLCLSSIALQLIGFLYRIGLSRFGGAEVIGMYQLVMPAYYVITSFTMSGLTLAVSRLSAEFYGRQNPDGVRGVVRFSQIVFFALFLCAAVPVVLFPDFIAGTILSEPKVKAALLWLLPCIFLTGYENIFKNCFHGIKFIAAPIVSELTEQIVRTISGLGLLILIAPKDPGRATALIIIGMVISEVFSVGILTGFYARAKQKQLKSGRDSFACIGCELIEVSMNFYWVIKGAKIKIQWKNWFVTPFLSGAAAGFCTWLLFHSLSGSGHGEVAVLLLCILCALVVFGACLHFLGIRFFRYLRTLFTEDGAA